MHIYTDFSSLFLDFDAMHYRPPKAVNFSKLYTGKKVAFNLFTGELSFWIAFFEYFCVSPTLDWKFEQSKQIL